MPAPAAQPPAGGAPGGKRLPWWAWAAAAAVGLVIGAVLLRKGGGGGTGSSDGGAAAGQEGGGGGGGGGGIPPDILDALLGRNEPVFGVAPDGSASTAPSSDTATAPAVEQQTVSRDAWYNYDYTTSAGVQSPAALPAGWIGNPGGATPAVDVGITHGAGGGSATVKAQ